jgi:SAM-dependent methyltransferase
MDLDSLKPRERFSRVANDYSRYRPGYPHEIVETLARDHGLERASVIADIGSGTGNLSKLFIDNGNVVYAVEPNPDKRSKAESFFTATPSFVSVIGAAESTTLQDSIADFIIAGQAFHWFDKNKTRVEFERIIKEKGFVVLVWNKRNNTKPMMQRYKELVTAYCPDYKKIGYTIYSKEELDLFFKPNRIETHTFEYHQVFSFDELTGRLRSSSYSPPESSDSYKELVKKLKKLFDEYEEQGTIRFEYTTDMYVSKII